MMRMNGKGASWWMLAIAIVGYFGGYVAFRYTHENDMGWTLAYTSEKSDMCMYWLFSPAWKMDEMLTGRKTYTAENKFWIHFR
jgi:hypothetical protein